MERRDFLKVVGSAAGIGVASRTLLASALAPRAPAFRAWTWFHGNNTTSKAAWRTRFARLRAAGITGLLVADGDIARIAAAAKAEGLEYHRWIHRCIAATTVGPSGITRNGSA